ncbi:molybdenum cofactor guanylyltransferase [Paraclostridium ghonii]|uniref:molybdenum cofactor guanylyltransferase n=1 Tax=Paraclostridium ghonii TaxID=29358 RepID=UPI00202CADFD|nr:molybdenum cofactor guanylyltransferase [Paeniclostridium ghonii]MCM0165572.1 molybdenum cofactor guanylyltransferase [Paeniclostridium ghonii]
MSLCKSAVILAGGKSSRMKFDKQFLVIYEKRLVYDLANKLKKNFNEIIIVTNKPEFYNDCDYKIVSDEIKDCGPLSGIHIGLKCANSEYVYFLACDMPNIDDNYIKFLKDTLNEENDAYICKFDNFAEPFHAIYKKSLFNDIGKFLLESDEKSIVRFLASENKNITYLNKDDFNKNNFNKNIFINLNNQQDLHNFIKEVEINGDY